MVAQGVKDMEVKEELDHPAIKKYTIVSDFGYRMYQIQNGDMASTYQETMNYPTFDGMTLLHPEKGSSYEIKVPAQE